ncbi:hypothetical protein Dimus_013342 [Dionaea muscipula]
MHVAAYKEFYANLTVSMSKEKEVSRIRVRGVNIELDSMILASILGIPGNTGICEYTTDVWEESKFCKTLEIKKKFTNDDMITTARRVKSTEMKPFQRFLHFMVMKNLVRRFGKRDTTSFMDLTYMDHLLTWRLVNLPRVISVPAHELPYGDWLTMVFEAFNIPLIDKQGEEPRRYDFFEETFLNMCQLKREQGVWCLEIGGIRRRDDEDEVPAENDQNEEVENEEQNNESDFEWEADEVQGSADVVNEVQEVPAPVSEQQKETATAEVDPLIPIGSISDSDFAKFQAEFNRARADKLQAELDKAQIENVRLEALL